MDSDVILLAKHALERLLTQEPSLKHDRPLHRDFIRGFLAAIDDDPPCFASEGFRRGYAAGRAVVGTEVD